jgi:GAF domain-containing protein
MSSCEHTQEPSLRLITSDSDPLPGLIREVNAGIPGCHAVSVAVLREGSPLEVTGSQFAIRWLTEIQYRNATGPCWEAMVSGQTVAVDDIAVLEPDDGWAHIARAYGITAALALPIPAPQDAAAVLTVCTRAGTGWTWAVRTTATWFAAYVGQALQETKPSATEPW